MLDDLHQALKDAPQFLRQAAGIPGVWLAGGWLRDAYWGKRSSDIDLAVEGAPDRLLEVVSRSLDGQHFKLNARFESYGLAVTGCEVHVVPLHQDGPQADIARRDYTVNTLLFPLDKLEFIGTESAARTAELLQRHESALLDLDTRTLRMTSRESMVADPLRILRGYRLLANLGMQVEPATREAWRELAELASLPAAERIHDELVKWFSGDLGNTLRMAAGDGVLWKLLPPLEATMGCDQLGYHHLDVWEHTLLALSKLDEIKGSPPTELAKFGPQLDEAWDSPIGGRARAGALTRLALLFHDIAKPLTRELRPDGRPSFHGHQEVGVRVARPLLESLKFSNEEIQFVTLLIREHMRLGYYSEPQRLTSKLTYRFIRELGAATPLMILHTLADCAATLGPLSGDSWKRHLESSGAILDHFFSQDRVARPQQLLDGSDIMRLTGLSPGPRVGVLKEALKEATAAGEVNSRSDAENFVRSLQASE